MIHDHPVRHDIHTCLPVYTYININIIMITKKLSDIIRSRLRELPYSCNTCVTLRIVVLNIAKASNASNPFTLPFGYLSHDFTTTVHLPQWAQPFQPTVIVLPSVVLTHAPSFM